MPFVLEDGFAIAMEQFYLSCQRLREPMIDVSAGTENAVERDFEKVVGHFKN